MVGGSLSIIVPASQPVAILLLYMYILGWTQHAYRHVRVYVACIHTAIFFSSSKLIIIIACIIIHYYTMIIATSRKLTILIKILCSCSLCEFGFVRVFRQQ